MKAGDLNRKITIQRQQSISDGGGGRAMNWQDHVEVFAKIEASGGNKRFFGDQNEYPGTHKMTIRYRDDLKSSDRIRYRYERKGVPFERFFLHKKRLGYHWASPISGDYLHGRSGDLTLHFNIKVDNRWKEVFAKHQILTKKTVLRAGSLVRDSAIKSITSGNKTGKIVKKANSNVTHQRSAEGQAPAADTGFLHNNISVEVHENGLGVDIASNAEYSAALEFGTSTIRPRPFLVPALEENKRKIADLFIRDLENSGGNGRG